MTSLAPFIVGLIGCLITAGAVFGLAFPDKLLRAVSSVWAKPFGLPFAIGVRLIFGAALLLSAPISRLPIVFEGLGYISLAAAVAIPILGRSRLDRLIQWFAQLPPVVTRVWLVFALLFGVFIIYGLLPAT